MKRSLLAMVVGLVSIGMIALPWSRRPAAVRTFVVDTAADVDDANLLDGVCDTGGGVCTLRAAIEQAQALPGLSEIDFDASLPSPSTVLLSLGPLSITKSMVIKGNGSGSTIVDGGGGGASGHPVFVLSGSSVTVSISGLTIRNGGGCENYNVSNEANVGGGGVSSDISTLNLTDVALTQNDSCRGGGLAISTSETAVLDHCTISGNTAEGGWGRGGGIANDGSLTLTATSIEGNSSTDHGGGIYGHGSASIVSSILAGNVSQVYGGGGYFSGPVTLINSTIEGNQSGSGGGIYVEISGQLAAYNSTIANNQSGTGSSLFEPTGGGLAISTSGAASIGNTIVAGNFHPAGKSSASDDCLGTLTSLDYNLVQTTAGCTITGGQTNNIYGTDPNLGPLQDNGGPTQTQALLTGSPAIDAGNPSGCTDNLGATLTTDQRGFPRPIDGRCDIGAYEFGSAAPTPLPGTATATRTPTATPTRTPTVAASSVEPQALVVDPGGDGLFEPGETVAVDPSWKDTTGSPISLTGTASSFSGPSGASYGILDDAASYGSIPAGTTESCAVASNCYSMTVIPGGSRPVTHWDATFTETTSSGPAKVWTLHIGGSFTDVPASQPFYKKIETLLHNNITAGCTATTYCPGDNVARSQMAIFIAKGMAGGGGNVPVSGMVGASAYNCASGGGGVSLFSDVLPTDPFCKHVHYIASKNVTSGCSAGKYCPNDTLSRLEMASFIAKAAVAPGGGAAIPLTYGPDPQTGLSYSCDTGSPSIHFTDVPAANSFCKHVHYLWAKGIIAGCSATTYCPTGTVSRDQMAKFLVNAFALALYGP